MELLALLLLRMIDFVTYLMEILLYSLHGVWVVIVRAAIGLIDALDDWFPDYGILDNAILRGVVMGAVGFLLGVILMIFLALAIGAWKIPLAFVLTILFCTFVGVIADPDRTWEIGDFPNLGGRDKPKTPLNL